MLALRESGNRYSWMLFKTVIIVFHSPEMMWLITSPLSPSAALNLCVQKEQRVGDNVGQILLHHCQSISSQSGQFYITV